MCRTNMIMHTIPSNLFHLMNRLKVITLYMSLLTFPTFINAANSTTATQLNGVLIHKIATYLTWQKESNNNLAYCFVGKRSHPVGNFLKTQKEIGRLPSNISIINLDSLSNSRVKDCDLLYVDKDANLENDEFQHISKTTFTLTNSKELLSDGFIVSIELDQNKPLLTLSKSNLKNSNIHIDSRFLSVVNVVK